jgi:predicted ArsR family transcriptional regulator
MTGRWKAVAALVDPSRRALYDYVRRADHPVSREEAADAGHMSRNLAAFHLDKLVEAGLLRTRYQAPTDQPRGRGRAPKVYQAAGDGVAVTIPERRYEIIAQILADAVAEDPAHADRAALRHARRHGRDLGAQLHASGDDAVAVVALMAGFGFEPRAQAGRVLLHNCPFHALVSRQSTLVCALNHAFLAGLLDGAGVHDMQARLAPRPGGCCVEIAGAGTDPTGDPGSAAQGRIGRVD